MASVRITPEDLHNKAESLRRSASNLCAELTRIRYDVYSLRAGWVDEGILSLSDSVFAKAKDIETLAGILVNMAADMDDAADSMEQTDLKIANSFFSF